MNRLASLGASILLGAVVSTPAFAEDRRVKVINETTYDIVRFYGSNVGSSDWEEDILGADILYAGDAVLINFDDGTGYCMFDFKVIFEDGDEIIRNRVNVCEVEYYRLTE